MAQKAINDFSNLKESPLIGKMSDFHIGAGVVVCYGSYEFQIKIFLQVRRN